MPKPSTPYSVLRILYKGGAGTFGFMQVSNFTHVVETLLDEIRSETRQMTTRYVDLFLQSVDCLRAMLTSLQSGEEPDSERAAGLKSNYTLYKKPKKKN